MLILEPMKLIIYIQFMFLSSLTIKLKRSNPNFDFIPHFEIIDNESNLFHLIAMFNTMKKNSKLFFF